MEGCLSVGKRKRLFAHLLANSEDGDVLAQWKIETTKIIYNSSKVRLIKIALVSYFSDSLRESKTIDLVANLFWEVEKCRRHTASWGRVELSKDLRSSHINLLCYAHLCDAYGLECFVAGE